CDARAPASNSVDARFRPLEADTSRGTLAKLLLIARLNRFSGSHDAGRSELKLQLDNARTPWGNLKLGRSYLYWTQSFTNPMPVEANVDWELFEISTPWGEIPNARFTGHSHQSPDGSGRLQSELTLASGVFQSEWFQLKINRFTARLVHSPDSLLPEQTDWQWQVDRPQSRWGEARHFQLDGQVTRTPVQSQPQADASWGWWAALEPFRIDWNAHLDDVTLTNLLVDKLFLSGQWRAPRLALQQLHAELFGHQLEAVAQVNAASRETTAQVRFDFDIH